MLAGPAAMLLGLAAAGALLHLLPLRDAAALRAMAAGGHGAAVFFGVALLGCAVGLPRPAAAFAAGYGFGAWGGFALAMAAQTAACLIDFGWARLVARRWSEAWLRRRPGGRWQRLTAFLAANPFRATLTLRLLPVGNNLALNLLGGVCAIPLGPFLAATVLGYLPQTLVFALLGGGVAVARWVEITLAVALFAASAGLGIALARNGSSAASADALDGAIAAGR
jgi:uncharacterized membrane protein YdjX (TVP38/TMEM64 family)